MAPSSTTAAEQEANEQKARAIPITGDYAPLAGSTPLPELPIPAPPTGRSPFVPPPDEDAQRWRADIDRYTREAEASPKARGAQLFLEIGRIYEEQLAEPREAATAYQRAFTLDSADPSVLAASRSLFTKVANWPMVLQILEYEIRAEPVVELKAALLAERGMIHESKLEAPEQALRAFSAALDVWPEEPTAIAGLERLHLMRREYAALYEVYQRALEHAQKRYRRLPLLLASAQLAEDRLDRPEQAIGHYQELLELDPHSAVAVEALRRLALAVEDWPLLVDALKRWADMVSDPVEAARRCWVAGRIERDRLGDVEAALNTQLAALERDPDSLSVLRDIEEIYSDNDHPEEVVKVLQREAEVCAEPRERVPVLLRLGEVLEQLGRPEEAMEVLEQAVEALPRNFAARHALGRLYAKLERHAELAALFAREAELEEDQTGKLLKLVKLAGVRAARLDDPAGAIEALTQALELDPNYEPALDLLKQLLTAEERWAELYELLLAQVERTEDEEPRLFLCDTAGRIAQDSLKDLDRAKRAFERALQLRPKHRIALRALGRIAELEGRWEDRLVLLRQELEASKDPAARLELMYRIAGVQETHLGDAAAAIAQLEELMAVSPGYLPALRSVSRLYRKTGRKEALVTACSREANATESLEHKLALLFTIAEVQDEDLRDEASAVQTLEEILALEPENTAALRALATLHRRAERYESLVDVLRLEADTLRDPADKVEVLLSIATLCEERLDRADQAAEVFQEILRAGVRSEVAVDGLVRIYSTAGLWNALSSALRSAVEQTKAPEVKAALLVRAAGVAGDRLGNLDAAASALEEALKLQPDSLSVLTQLERVSVARRDWPRVLSVSALLSHHETDPRLFAARQLRIAEIKETLVEPPESGAEHYRLALETVPDHPVALRELELAYLRATQWEGLVQLYKREALVTKDPARKLRLLTRAADVAEHRLGDDAKAGELYRRALELDADYLPAIVGLRRAAERSGDAETVQQAIEREGAATTDTDRAEALLFELGQQRQEAGAPAEEVFELYERLLARNPAHQEGFHRLEALYLEHDKDAALLDLTQRRASAIEDPEERLRLSFSAGQIAEDKLEDLPAAIGLYQAVLEADAEHAGALLRLGGLLVKTERWDEAVQVLHRGLAVAKDPTAVHQNLRALGLIYQHHRRDLVKCVQSLQAALQAKEDDLEALTQLAEVYEEGQDWRSAVNVRLRQVELQPEPEAQVETLLQLGRLYEVQLADPEHAVLAYEKALQLAPTEPRALKALVNLHERMGELDALDAMLQRRLEALPEAERAELVPHLVRLAEAYQHRDDPKAATARLRQALALAPDDEATLAALAELYGAQDASYPDAIATHRALLARDPFRADSYRALFRLYLRLNQPDRAFVAAELLVALRCESREEGIFYAERKARVPPGAAGSLDAEAHERWLVHPAERVADGGVRAALSALGPELSKLYPGDLGLYQLNPRQDRLSARSPDPVRLRVNGLSQVLQPPSFELWLTQAYELELFIENTRPLAFVVGGQLSRRLQEKDQRFLLARELERMCGGHHLLRRIPEEELRVIHQAVARMGDPAAPLSEDPQLVEAMTRTLTRAVSGRVRRKLEAAGRAISGVPWALEGYRQACVFTRDRAGLALTNDIEVALRNVAGRHGVGGLSYQDAAGARELLGGVDEVRELLAYAISEDYFELRASLGFAIDG